MNGLNPLRNRDFVFDTPSGRIIENTVFGRGKREQVNKFYNTTLPELGWQRIREQVFKRDGEQLHIEFYGQDGDLSVRFTLTPAK